MRANPFRTDLFVVGGGPAGLAAAISASRKGLRVTVADGGVPPVDKACGEGLLPETVDALREMDVVVPSHAGFRLRGIGFLERELATFANFRGGQGIGLRRTVLHELLITRAEELGVRLLWRTPVTGLTARGVQHKGGFTNADWVIGADGNGSRVRKWSGLDATARKSIRFAARRHYRIAPWTEFMEVYWGTGRQAYVTPVGSEEVCVVVMADRPEQANFEACTEEMPELAERLENAEIFGRERGAVTQIHRLRRVTAGNVALVGDASGSVDAITGQGLWLAFRQAFALAESISRDELRSYEAAHRTIARRPRMMGQLLTMIGRRPGLRRRLLLGSSEHPEIFRRLLALHCGKVPAAEWAMTGAELSWRMLTA